MNKNVYGSKFFVSRGDLNILSGFLKHRNHLMLFESSGSIAKPSEILGLWVMYIVDPRDAFRNTVLLQIDGYNRNLVGVLIREINICAHHNPRRKIFYRR